MLKTVLKVLLASTLILGVIAVGGTIFAAKGIDKAGITLIARFFLQPGSQVLQALFNLQKLTKHRPKH